MTWPRSFRFSFSWLLDVLCSPSHSTGQVGLIYNMQQSSHRLECSYIVRYCDLQSVVRHTASEVVEIQLYRSFDESSLLSCCLLYKRPLPPRESVRDEKVLWALSISSSLQIISNEDEWPQSRSLLLWSNSNSSGTGKNHPSFLLSSLSIFS